MTRFKIDVTFMNRESEMSQLSNYLEGRPGHGYFAYDRRLCQVRCKDAGYRGLRICR